MRNDFCSGYLQHHGIQGQKWGVRNGPPYPLESKGSSEKKPDKPKGLTKKQKTIIAVGAAVAVTALAVYGTYKLGGPKGVAASAKNIASHINTGKEASRPYMKMNLQYFANSKKRGKISKPKTLSKKEMEVINELGRKSYRGSTFQTKKFKDLSNSKAESIAMEAVRVNRKAQVLSGEEIVTYPYGNYMYYIATDVENGRIVGRQFIPDSVTNNKLPNVLPKIVKGDKNGGKNRKT